jgi:hypothetical protein
MMRGLARISAQVLRRVPVAAPVVGVVGVAVAEPVVVIDEVDGPQAAVVAHLTDDAPYAVAVVVVVFGVEAHAIVAQGIETVPRC